MSAPVEQRPLSAASRDRWIDLLRAGSLSVVVLWHWVFTIIDWQADGPHGGARRRRPVHVGHPLHRVAELARRVRCCAPGRVLLGPDRFRASFGWLLTWTGLFALIGLTNMNFYPRSTVGVPGESFSNLGPPTVVIVALACFQIGVTRLVRDRVLSFTEHGVLRRGADWITVNAQVLFLGHAFAYAVTYVWSPRCSADRRCTGTFMS